MHPFMVSIWCDKHIPKHRCGGALITYHTVLTAGHCVDDPKIILSQCNVNFRIFMNKYFGRYFP